jgi:serine/threonine protein phosphatase PrpC
MSNQEVIDYCRFHIARTKGNLGLVCESLMDYCLAPDCDLGSVGCDNMTVVLVALLRDGQTYEAWTERIVAEVAKAGLVVDDSKSVANRNAGNQAHVLGYGAAGAIEGEAEEEISGNY